MIISHSEYVSFKEKTVLGRYVVNEDIARFIKKRKLDKYVTITGFSVQELAIRKITLGKGKQKVLMWSQMHGNESTTTKAVLDLINFLCSDNPMSFYLLENCTLCIIPMLNPDGAAAYTRVNANGIDLNRDAQNRSQPESAVLREVYDSFRPDFCFNLHDQRTIFNVGDTPLPATVSFLAPAFDIERNISETRGLSMQLIVAMNTLLQKVIPGQVGRYDDAFNSNCVGDTFQMLKTPTILFEAGHAPGDYEREITREYIFYALLKALDTIGKNKIEGYDQTDYFSIPENRKCFLDILVTDVDVINPSKKPGESVGILFRELLRDGRIHFIPQIETKGNLEKYHAHQILSCSKMADLEELKQLSIWQDIIQ